MGSKLTGYTPTIHGIEHIECIENMHFALLVRKYSKS
jgi:hypothetical protein